jgi:hypothetical protein
MQEGLRDIQGEPQSNRGMGPWLALRQLDSRFWSDTLNPHDSVFAAPGYPTAVKYQVHVHRVHARVKWPLLADRYPFFPMTDPSVAAWLEQRHVGVYIPMYIERLLGMGDPPRVHRVANKLGLSDVPQLHALYG